MLLGHMTGSDVLSRVSPVFCFAAQGDADINREDEEELKNLHGSPLTRRGIPNST